LILENLFIGRAFTEYIDSTMKKILLPLLILLCASTATWAVPIKFLNNSLRSIPLQIPGVMNPNLSPLSSSGVDLAVGQKVFFFANNKKGASKKRYLLLEVTEDLAGKSIAIDELIKTRRAELGL
jgi:hypothetical protein